MILGKTLRDRANNRLLDFLPLFEETIELVVSSSIKSNPRIFFLLD